MNTIHTNFVNFRRMRPDKIHRSVTPIRYDNHGGGLSYPASQDIETPVFSRGPAFLVSVHLRDRMSGAGGEADVVRDAPNDRL